MKSQGIFVQIGATRDGLDPYLYAARRRRMGACLVETPAYIHCRQLLRRREFGSTLPVSQPANPEAVMRALAENGVKPRLVLSGFEQYTECAFAVADRLKIPLCAGVADSASGFKPMCKAAQRKALALATPWIRQPWFLTLEQQNPDEQMEAHLPLVVKPDNSGGGWGVCLAETMVEVNQALAALNELPNYDGSPLAGVLVEEFLSGSEASVQGICYSGQARILTYCEKIINQQRAFSDLNLFGFREVGHLAVPGEHTSSRVVSFVTDCLQAVNYHDGPFHIDLMNTSEGPVFIEMGFRLSGGRLAEVVRRVSGSDWGEDVFAWFLEQKRVVSTDARERGCLAHLVARSASEIEAARDLQKSGYDVEIELQSPIPAISGLTTEQGRLLKADLSRHLGSLGYIWIATAEIEELRRLARHVLAGSPSTTLQYLSADNLENRRKGIERRAQAI